MEDDGASFLFAHSPHASEGHLGCPATHLLVLNESSMPAQHIMDPGTDSHGMASLVHAYAERKAVQNDLLETDLDIG